MANPQKENGHIQIATELWREFYRLNLSPTEWKVMLFVLGKTYGFNKTEDWISLSQFQRGCLIDRTQVCRSLKKLVAKQLLVKTKNGYAFNKNYDEWVVAKQPPSGGIATSGQTVKRVVAKQSIRVVAKQPPTIDNITKNNLQQTVALPKKEIDFEAFWKLYPRKKSKGDALKAWSKLSPDERAKVFAVLPAHCKQPDWTKDGGKYIPYPASWLRASGWEDEIVNMTPINHIGTQPLTF